MYEEKCIKNVSSIQIKIRQVCVFNHGDCGFYLKLTRYAKCLSKVGVESITLVS